MLSSPRRLARRASCVLATLLCLGVLAPVPVLAQETGSALPEIRVLVIDTVRLMRDASAMRHVLQVVERSRTEFQQVARRQEDELREANQELIRQRQQLGEEGFETRRRELQQQAAQLQLEARRERSEIDQAMNDAVQAIREKARDIVQAEAEARGAQLVVQRAELVYAAPGLDITDAVLRRLDEELPVVEIEIE